MQKYRNKPIVIEAIQYTGENRGEVYEFMDQTDPMHGDKEVKIDTLEGTMTAQIKDWIIRGIKGEFYPCKPDIFEAIYERLED